MACAFDRRTRMPMGKTLSFGVWAGPRRMQPRNFFISMTKSTTMPKRKPAFPDLPADKQEEAQDWIAAGKPKSEAKSEEIESPDVEPVLIPTSLRLPQPLINRLNRASFEQKTERKRPQTRQGIIIEALGQ